MYLKYRKNFYSQNGEDGIIEKNIEDLKLDKKKLSVCEFGAVDGKLFSNTFNLVEKFRAKALLIEGDKEKFKLLLKTAKKHKTITPVERFVSPTGINSLDQILLENNFPINFDVLSIDIDGYDLEIWENLKNYFPKIVIIEINSSILPGIYQTHCPEKKQQGNSFSSILSLANKNGYSLIAHTGNLIFLKNDYLNNINFPKKFLDNPELLFIKDWVYSKNKEPFILRMLKFIIPSSLKKKISSGLKYKFIRVLYKIKRY